MTLMRNRTRITEAEARVYFRQICRAVMYMEEQEAVLHCDIKLGNVYLAGDMSVKIGDFGLAMTMNNQSQMYRGMCGTPNYLAPEWVFLDNSS